MDQLKTYFLTYTHRIFIPVLFFIFSNIFHGSLFAQTCVPVKVILQPFDYKVCNSGDAIFYIVASNTTIYKWQINTGFGWVDLNDDTKFIGTTKDTLIIKGVTSAMNNNLLRCTVTNGCSTDHSFPGALTIGSPETPTISIEYLNTSICSGVPVGIIAKVFKPGQSPVFQWKVNNVDAGPNASTFVTNNLHEGDIVNCVMTSDASCITSPFAVSNFDTIHFQPTVLPVVSILEADTVICSGSTAPSTFTILAINGGVDPDFEWSINGKVTGTNSNILSTIGLKSGDTLRVSMRSKDPCANPVVVTSKPMILDITPLVISSIQISSPGTLICSGEPITFTAKTINGGEEEIFHWYINSVDQHHDSVNFTTALLNDNDSVSCVLTSKVPCFKPVNSNSIRMKVVQGPSITYPADTLILAGGSVLLAPVVSGEVASYDWEPSIYLNNNTIQQPISTPLHTITYTLKTTSVNGCVVKGSTTIQVIDHVNVPNTFTPNNDGINDKWEILGLSTYNNCKIQVFDRYGQLVFSETGYSVPWDGTRHGKPVPPGTYYYIIETKTDKKLFTGYVTVLR